MKLPNMWKNRHLRDMLIDSFTELAYIVFCATLLIGSTAANYLYFKIETPLKPHDNNATLAIVLFCTAAVSGLCLAALLVQLAIRLPERIKTFANCLEEANA